MLSFGKLKAIESGIATDYQRNGTRERAPWNGGLIIRRWLALF